MATTEVKVQINADGSQVPREADKVKKSLVGIGKEGEALSKSFAKVGGVIAGALSVGAITSFLSRVNQAADQLDGLSQRLGASASGLQTLQIAAAQAGGSAEAMNNALAKMSVSLGDALAGSKPVNEALAKLGLTAKELAGLRADESMRRIAGALSDVGNTYERAAISQAIFGKGAKELQEFFAVAPGQISETEQALADAGATLDDIDVAKIGLMNDQLAMQSTIVSNLGIKFLANLSPAIGVATESFANIIRTMGGATEAGKTFGVVMTGAIKLVEAGIFGLAAVFETLRGIGAVVFASLTNAVGNLIGVLARAAEIANLDIAQPLRAASNATLSLGTSFSNVAASAFDNAKAASAGAITAGLDLLRASEIFAAASDAALAKAEQAVARTQAIQGQVSPGAADAAARASGAAGAAGAGSRGGPLLSKDLLKDTGRAIADFDPLADPQVLRQIEINSALQAVQDAHDQTMLGKIEAVQPDRARLTPQLRPAADRLRTEQEHHHRRAGGQSGEYRYRRGRQARQVRQGARHRADHLEHRPGNHESLGRARPDQGRRGRRLDRCPRRRAARQHPQDEHRQRRIDRRGPRRRHLRERAESQRQRRRRAAAAAGAVRHAGRDSGQRVLEPGDGELDH
jgi:hypothetical protein